MLDELQIPHNGFFSRLYDT